MYMYLHVLLHVHVCWPGVNCRVRVGVTISMRHPVKISPLNRPTRRQDLYARFADGGVQVIQFTNVHFHSSSALDFDRASPRKRSKTHCYIEHLNATYEPFSTSSISVFATVLFIWCNLVHSKICIQTWCASEIGGVVSLGLLLR